MKEYKIEWSLALLSKYSQIILESKSELTKSMMLFIVHLKHRPGMHQDQLADMFKMNRSSVTRAVSSLEKKGYIERIVDKENRRANTLHLTSSGENLYENVMLDLMEWMDIITSDMTAEEVRIGMRILSKMAGNACRHLGDDKLATLIERS